MFYLLSENAYRKIYFVIQTICTEMDRCNRTRQDPADG